MKLGIVILGKVVGSLSSTIVFLFRAQSPMDYYIAGYCMWCGILGNDSGTTTR